MIKHKKMLKNILLLVLVIFTLNTNSWAQKEVFLKVNHFLGEETFELNKTIKNNLDQQFNIKRLDYFISNITLFHDDDQITKLDDIYILVRKGEKVQQLLGSLNLQKLDSLTFFIGVDYENNHADPSLWPPDHALAPKFPDMHWGWASGYRFVAIEGNNGQNLSEQYQVHAVGNELLKTVKIVTNGWENNDNLIIDIDADYTNAMYDLNMNKVIFIHGSSKEAAAIMNNFQDRIFTASSGTSSTEVQKIGLINIYPNPVIDNHLQIYLNDEQLNYTLLQVRDITGKIIFQTYQLKDLIQVEVLSSGLYIVELLKESQIGFRSIVIKQ